MKKQKIALVVLLALVLSVCCMIFAACGDNKASYKITWSANNATITATDYTELPTEVQDGTEISFTVTANSGYEILAVKQGKTTLRADSNGTYKFIVSADTTIEVTTNEILSSITVTAPTKLSYYAGETLDVTGMAVTANYATGRKEEVTSYSVKYQNGEAFSLGDTSFSVTYSGLTETVNLNEAVIGLITVDLYGGELSEDVLNVWKSYTNYNYNVETGIITWTYDKAFEADFVLPGADDISKVINGNEFPFKSWSGVSNDKIAKGTNSNVKITATYDPQLLEISSLSLITETEDETVVPYLIVEGKFVAATEAYLYLYEGNDKVELKGTTVTKGSSDDFVLKFDLREFVKSGYKGKWMDIKFCAAFGDRVETQEINLANYSEDFVDTDDMLAAQIGETWYKFYYELYSNTLKLVYDSGTLAQMAFTPTAAKLEVRTVDNAEVPYLVVNGYIDAVIDEETAKAAVESLFIDLMNKSSTSQWATITYDKNVTSLGDLSFEITMSLTNAVERYSLFAHIYSGANFVLSEAKVESGTVIVGNMSYTLCVDQVWGSNLVTINVFDITKLNDDVTNVSLETANDVVYLVIKGTYNSLFSEADAKAEIEEFAIALQQYNSWEYLTPTGNESSNSIYTVEVSDGEFIIKVAVSDESYANNTSAGKYIYGHYKGNNFTGSTSLITSETVTVGELSYTLVIGIEGVTDSWTTSLIIIKVAAAE